MSHVQNTQPVSIYQKLKNSSSVKYSGSDPSKCDIPGFERRDPAGLQRGREILLIRKPESGCVPI